uniref:Uncharacterized protein n=1 Tax=Kalanchoe fedtschenkoi TaxID=63787 RepID=A0A7N0RJQ4_KALFE
MAGGKILTQGIRNQLRGDEISYVTEENVFNALCVESAVKETMCLLPDQAPKQMELRLKLGASFNPAGKNMNSGLDVEKVSHSSKQDTISAGSHSSSRGIGLDLNVAHVSSFDYEDPFHFKNRNDSSRSIEMSESGSNTGSLEEKDPMSVWKAMKENGFISNYNNRKPPPVPERRGRKSKSDAMQKKMEMAKKERVDRFARIAAPSGLLNELNPGIINHVRNSKQVHSIIEALVKSERIETGNVGVNKPVGKLRNLNKDLMKESSSSLKEEGLGFCSSQTEIKMHDKAFTSSLGREDDVLSLRLSSSSTTKCSGGISALSCDDNLTSVSLLSVKAASVASQWLDLLHQDVKGRLAALRRSKKRARSVIQKDMPSLSVKEFSSTDPHDTSSLVCKFPKNDVADLHQARWSSLFSQMEMALSEEEKHLEGWLNQVREMQLHCERGLQNEPWKSSFWPGAGDRKPATISNEKDLAVTAAAASIYSTCSFLLNKDTQNT